MSEPELPLLSRAFIRLTLANLSLSIAGALFLHLPGFLALLGAREATIGRVLATQALAAALLGPVSGRLMDRRGPRAVARAGAVLSLIATGSYLAIHAIGPALYALRVLDGAGATFLYASLFTYAAELVPPSRRTHGIALFGASGLAPMAISSLLGDWILATASYRALFLTASAFCAFGAGLCWTLPYLPRTQVDAIDRAGAGFWRTLSQRDLLPIWSAALAFFSCMAGLLAFMKTFVLKTGFGSLGSFFGVYASVALTLRLLFFGLPQRMGLRRMVLPALGSYGLGCILLACAAGPSSLLVAAALCGVGHAYCFPVLLSLVMSRARPDTRGTATGFYTAIDWTGNLLAPPVLGALIERTSYSFGFATLGVFGLAGILGFYAFDGSRRDE